MEHPIENPVFVIQTINAFPYFLCELTWLEDTVTEDELTFARTITPAEYVPLTEHERHDPADRRPLVKGETKPVSAKRRQVEIAWQWHILLIAGYVTAWRRSRIRIISVAPSLSSHGAVRETIWPPTKPMDTRATTKICFEAICNTRAYVQ